MTDTVYGIWQTGRSGRAGWAMMSTNPDFPYATRNKALARARLVFMRAQAAGNKTGVTYEVREITPRKEQEMDTVYGIWEEAPRHCGTWVREADQYRVYATVDIDAARVKAEGWDEMYPEYRYTVRALWGVGADASTGEDIPHGSEAVTLSVDDWEIVYMALDEVIESTRQEDKLSPLQRTMIIERLSRITGDVESQADLKVIPF